jgi:hypothetical protein
VRRPLVLLLTILALTLGGSALAAEPEGNGGVPLAGYSVTCSATLRGAGCFLEKPVIVFGPLEVAIGFDARASWAASERSYAAPYAILGWYEPRWAAWLEIALPDTHLPIIGKPDPFRFGFTVRF